jgi:hypothetical protein
MILFEKKQDGRRNIDDLALSKKKIIAHIC